MSRTASKHLILDREILGEIDQLRHTLRLAQASEKYNTQGLADEAPRLERQLFEMSEKAAAEAVRFTVKALPGEEFDELCRHHPLSPEQLERFREHAKVVPWAAMEEYNPQSMGPDLLVACLIEPDWGEAKIREFWKECSKGEQNQLWNLALRVQLEGADLPFYNAAIATTNGGGDKSTSAVNEDSPSLSF